MKKLILICLLFIIGNTCTAQLYDQVIIAKTASRLDSVRKGAAAIGWVLSWQGYGNLPTWVAPTSGPTGPTGATGTAGTNGATGPTGPTGGGGTPMQANSIQYDSAGHLGGIAPVSGQVPISRGAASAPTSEFVGNDTTLLRFYMNQGSLYNIAEHGADTTGVVDASSYINAGAAFVGKNKNGGIVYLPCGTYAISDSFTTVLTPSGVTLASQILMGVDTSSYAISNNKTIIFMGAAPGCVTINEKAYNSKTQRAMFAVGGTSNTNQQGFANFQYIFKNINIVPKYNNATGVINMAQASIFQFDHMFIASDSILKFFKNHVHAKPKFNSNVAIVMPQNNNNLINHGMDSWIEGFYAGILLGEGSQIDNVFCGANYYSLLGPLSNHNIDFHIHSNWCVQDIKLIGTVGYTPTGGFGIAGPANLPITGSIDGESISSANFPWDVYTSVIVDSLNTGIGKISWSYKSGGSLTAASGFASKNSGVTIFDLANNTNYNYNSSNYVTTFENLGSGAGTVYGASGTNQGQIGATGGGQPFFTGVGTGTTLIYNANNQGFEMYQNNTATYNLQYSFASTLINIFSAGANLRFGTHDANNLQFGTNNNVSGLVNTSGQWLFGQSSNNYAEGNGFLQVMPGNESFTLARVGGTYPNFQHITSVGTPASGTETVLFSDSITKNTFANNGSILQITQWGYLAKSGTLKFYFGKNGSTADSLEFNTGGLAGTGNAWQMVTTLQRASNTVLNVQVAFIVTTASRSLGGTLLSPTGAIDNFTIGSGTALGLATNKYFWTVTGQSTAGLTANDITASGGFAQYITEK